MSTNQDGMMPLDIPSQGSSRSLLRKATNIALAANQICRLTDSYPKTTTRYVQLKLDQIYNSLSTLYARMFATQWNIFKPVAEPLANTAISIEEAQLIMGKIYISHWLMDLYNSNRECLEKLTPGSAFQHYSNQLPSSSHEYDAFLQHLNAVIRPTHVVGCFEDTLFVPLFYDVEDTMADNPFNMTVFSQNLPIFKAIINTMKDNKLGWKTLPISTETLGRPVWLFDWHSDNRVCSWFPTKGNYTEEDVTYAYVIGVACTPHLAQQDTDAAVRVADDFDVDSIQLSQYQRVEPRHYYGDYEVDDVTLHEVVVTVPTGDRPDNSISVRDSSHILSGAADEPMVREMSMKMMSLTTYIYYCRVILDIDDDARLSALIALLTLAF